MIYTVTCDGRKQTYEGFRSGLRLGKGKIAETIAVVFIEGETDTWALDPNKVELAVSELQRYYRTEHSGLNVDFVVYRNPTLYLSDTAD